MARTGHMTHEDRVFAFVADGAGRRGGPKVPDTVLESWRRCVETYGLDPGKESEPRILTQRELKPYRDQLDALAHIARSDLIRLHRQVAPAGHVVLLTDANGVTIDYLGDASQQAALKEAGLYLGAIWAEKNEGTNGVGTCLATGQSLTVFRDDHFRSRNAGLTCSVSPIFGPDGEVQAVLDISSMSATSRAAQVLGLNLVRAAARRIEGALFRYHFRDHWIVSLQEGAPDDDDAPRQLLAVDRERRITAVDGFSRAHGAAALVGQPIDRVFDRGLDRLFSDPAADCQAGYLRDVALGRDRLALLHGPADRPARIRSLPPRMPSPDTGSGGAGASRSDHLSLNDLAGRDPRLQQAVSIIRRVVDHDLPILLTGETGTGKEVFARSIHRESARADQAFVAVNCAAIPETLIESELFGYSAGAFTGARRQGMRGRILDADRGTLFLDEIGDMPLALQSRLLRVLAEREVLPIGATRASPVDVSLICATHKDLDQMVADGGFREDLYHRLVGVTIRLIPMREREDLADFIRHVWVQVTTESSAAVALSDDVVAVLAGHHWPGNVRELRNVLRLLLALSDGYRVALSTIPVDLMERLQSRRGQFRNGHTPEREGRSEILRPVENVSGSLGGPPRGVLDRELLISVLQRNRWTVTATARALGVSRSTIHRWIKSHGIVPPHKRA